MMDTTVLCGFRGIKSILQVLLPAIEASVKSPFGIFLEDLRDSFEISESLKHNNTQQQI